MLSLLGIAKKTLGIAKKTLWRDTENAVAGISAGNSRQSKARELRLREFLLEANIVGKIEQNA